MNTKKLLAMLLSSLGVFALGLAGCTTPETSSEGESTTPTPSDTSSVETPTSSDQGNSDTSVGEQDSPSSEEVIEDETLKTYSVNFNYDDVATGMSVWTDYDINHSRALPSENISGYVDESRHTLPIEKSSIPGSNPGSGYYYIAVDADGYIVYAAYSLGNGSGAPHDDYYHNQPSKDAGSSDYFVLHDDWNGWAGGVTYPNYDLDGDGVNDIADYNLYDFIIPEGGFVVKGFYNDTTAEGFVKLWNHVFVSTPAAAAPAPNWAFNGTTAGSLNKWFFSINEDRKLEVRERREGELVDENGDQEIATPSKGFTPTADEAPLAYSTFEGLAQLADGTAVENVKAVVTYIAGDYVFVQDAQGTNVLVYKPAGEVAVGDTVVVNGSKSTFGGHEQVGSATLTVLSGYGSLAAVAPIEVNAENVAETWVAANNNAPMKLVKAQVVKIDAADTSIVKVGETEVALYRATFPETVAVGDTVDVLCAMNMYNDQLQARVADASHMSRYYNVTVDVDGVEGAQATETKGYAKGESVTYVAVSPSDAYTFTHWAQVTKDAEGNEVLVEVTKDAEVTITVGEEDVEYRAVFEFAPWANLGDAHVLKLELANGVVNGGDASLAIFTNTESLKAATTVSGNNQWIANGWRTTLIVDAEGKVAVVSYNAAYCGLNPQSKFYGRHSSYADPAANPAFEIAEDGTWALVVPEGGFAVSMHTNNIDEMFAALGIAKTYVESSVDLDGVRLFLDKGNNNLVKVFNSEAKADVELNGVINAVGTDLPSVYNDKAENVTLGDYTVAVDANGKIIFAGRTASGYGGPADGFYHDGSYMAVAGQQCGIFLLDEQFAGWPAVTPDGVNAWTLYTVAVPTGAHIITGTEAQMMNLMLSIDPNYKAFSDQNKNYFEGVVDGLFNDTHVINVTENTKVANVDLVVSEPEAKDGVKATGILAEFAFNAETGAWEATSTFAKWTNFSLTYTTATGEEVAIWYDNTTITGDVVANGETYGDQWDGNLFIDSAANAEAHQWMHSNDGGATFKFAYNPTENTLTITKSTGEEPDPKPEPDPEPDPEPTPDPVNVSMMVPTTVNVYTAADESVTLGDITLAVDASGKVIFASYTAPGYGGPGDGFYHDGTYKWVAGQQCGIFELGENFADWATATGWGAVTAEKVEYNGQMVNPWGAYRVNVPEGVTVYTGASADMLPLVNAIFGSEHTEMANNNYFETTLADGAINHVVATLTPMVEVNFEHAADLTVLTSTSENPVLEDITVAVDASGKVIFASYTAPGYGGPGDGFYHDGTYKWVAGQQCGIFELGENFADWATATGWGAVAAEKVEYNGQMVNPWGAYRVNVPEGVTVYTGTAEEMLPMVNAIFGSEHTEMANNNYFETTLADGSQNHKVVTLTVAAPAEPVAIYSYGFEDLTGKNASLTNSSALEIFQADMGENASKLVSVTVNKIYNGNGTGGAYPNSSGFLKTGTGSVNGQIILTFAEDVQITKVVIVCHDWYTKSASYPTNSNTVSVNGSATQYAPYNETGAFEELVFEVDASNVVQIDTNKRIFISAIYVY